ncbi:MAG: tRNA threonylcarbamoyladenosine dehydratase [Muribaculaceae bacterium]|nr:tRNA threonylcarbamoyladenosine dehydratase [Muribaculaceae bacterium]
MIDEKEIFSRASLLLGDDVMKRLATIRVIVFGVGGVGSWCAESLVRSGVKHLAIVDCDNVAVSNINRQLMATTETVGQPKVEALKAHLLTVSPTAEIDARREVFTAETADNFDLDSYDYVIDAIDSLKDKVLLIERATESRAKFFSSMGAALKLDPTRIKVAEFRNVIGCPLARALRQRFKKMGRWPRRKFLCVYSDELVENKGVSEESLEVMPGIDGSKPSAKARINGSLMHITAIFGLTLAGLVINAQCTIHNA